MYKRLTVTLACLASLNLYAATEPAPASGDTAAAMKAPHFSPQTLQGRIFGTVLKTMDGGGYTYVLLDTGSSKVWAAAPRTEVRRGSMVAVSTRMPMRNFHSKALDQDFELVYFTDRIIRDNVDGGGSAPAKADTHKTAQPAPAAPVEGITRAEGGLTIAEILEQKQSLAGKTVRVRGKVVKYSSNILGRNWLHIRDSSSAGDLTVTTTDAASKGDVIVAEGKLVLDSDFGYGYVYAVLLEDSKVSVEP